MKILYGIQGTGNGHITRARALAPALVNHGIEVDYLMSGRADTPLFDTDIFGSFRMLSGLTLVSRNGQIDPLETTCHLRPGRLWRDIRELDLHGYDLVITDFEPITAWAARRSDVPSLGISHQYAFRHAVPQVRSITASLLYRHFAPASVELGCHWHHFGQPVMPPLAPVDTTTTTEVDERLILVYLPFENLDHILAYLRPLSDYRFAVYHPDAVHTVEDHISLNPTSRSAFQVDQARCSGVIANAGFGLSSEAIQLGKPLLVKPLAGQPEQQSNGLALEVLGLGQMTQYISPGVIRNWLPQRRGRAVRYPDMVQLLARWIAKGDIHNTAELIEQAWSETSGLPEVCMPPSRSLRLVSLGRRTYPPVKNTVAPGPGGISSRIHTTNSKDQLSSNQIA